MKKPPWHHGLAKKALTAVAELVFFISILGVPLVSSAAPSPAPDATTSSLARWQWAIGQTLNDFESSIADGIAVVGDSFDKIGYGRRNPLSTSIASVAAVSDAFGRGLEHAQIRRWVLASAYDSFTDFLAGLFFTAPPQVIVHQVPAAPVAATPTPAPQTITFSAPTQAPVSEPAPARVVFATTGVSQSYVDSRMAALAARIDGLAAASPSLTTTSSSNSVPATIQSEIDALQRQISLTNKIDQLSNVTLTNPTIIGGTNTNSGGTTFTGALAGLLSITGSGTSTFSSGLSVDVLNVGTTTASSTFANGLNLTKGCFAVNGTCVTGGGGGSGTVNSGTTGELAYYASNGTALTATSSLFLAPSGDIGIGTTSPLAKLDVAVSLLILRRNRFVSEDRD